MKDFFISYTGKDSQIAQWIAWELEEKGYSVIIQAWDFKGNWVHDMDRAMKESKKTIAVLSKAYIEALYTMAEWGEAFRKDPKGEMDLLIPVRIENFKPQGIFGQVVYVDFVNQKEDSARERLLIRVKGERNKPKDKPGYNLDTDQNFVANHSAVTSKPNFPDMPVDNYRKQSIYIGAASILLVLAILLFKSNIPDNLNTMLRILFAMGCAGLSAALIGYINFKKEGRNGITAGGGFAVFLIILFLYPSLTDPGPGPHDFNMMVYLKKSNDDYVSGKEISLSLPLTNGQEPGKLIPDSRGYLFTISGSYHNKEGELSIQSRYWMFDSNKLSKKIQLIDGNVFAQVHRNPQTLVLQGNINNGDSTFAKTTVTVNGKNYPVTQNAEFTIELPDTFIADSADALFTMAGYESRSLRLAVGVSNSVPALAKKASPGFKTFSIAGSRLSAGAIAQLKTILKMNYVNGKSDYTIKFDYDKSLFKPFGSTLFEYWNRGKVEIFINNNSCDKISEELLPSVPQGPEEKVKDQIRNNVTALVERNINAVGKKIKSCL